MLDTIEFILSLVIMVVAIVGSASKKARQARRNAGDKTMDSAVNEPDSDDFLPYSSPTRVSTSDDGYVEPMARIQAQKNKKYENLAPKSRIETILLETEEASEPIQLDLDDVETVKKAILYKEILDPKFDR